jgi:hypothetical protein
VVLPSTLYVTGTTTLASQVSIASSVLQWTGSSSYGVNLSGGTFSSGQIIGTGFLFGPAGGLTLNGTGGILIDGSAAIGIQLTSGVGSTFQIEGNNFYVGTNGGVQLTGIGGIVISGNPAIGIDITGSNSTAQIIGTGFEFGPAGNLQLSAIPTGTSVAYVCLRSDNVLIKSTTACM